MDEIELWAQAHQFTISALSSVSTVAAVVISLIVAWHSAWSTSTRYKASVNVMEVWGGPYIDGPKPTFLALHITNKGVMPLRIPFSALYLRTPFKRSFLLLPPADSDAGGRSMDSILPGKTYPVEVAPRASASLYYADPEALRARLAEDYVKMKWHEKILFRFTRIKVATDDGKVVTVRMDKRVRAAIRLKPEPKE